MRGGTAIEPRQPPIDVASHGLEPLQDELNREILVALGSAGPLTTEQLVRRLVTRGRSPAEGHLGQLLAAGLVERRRGDSAVAFRLTAAGRGLLALLGTATAWLLSNPRRAWGPANPIAWRAFGALADAWREALIEWIVRASPTAAELAAGIGGLSGRSLGRELSRLQGAGLVERRSDREGVERIRLTRWGRHGIAVLAAAAAWEARFEVAGREPIAVADAIVALLAALPLVRLRQERSGLVTLVAASPPGEPAPRRAGMVWATVRRGRVVGCGEGAPQGDGDASASGSFADWLAAVIGGRPALELGGDRHLAGELIAELHTVLYVRPREARVTLGTGL